MEELEDKDIQNSNLKSDEEILDLAADQVIFPIDTNGIYVYVCSYYNNGRMYDLRMVEEPKDYDFAYDVYMDIEQSKKYARKTVFSKELNVFKEESIILYAPKDTDPFDFYPQVRRVFFETLVTAGQEAAVERIKNEFGKAIVDPIGSRLVKSKQF